MSHWIYHPKEQAQIVTSEDYPIFLRNGWFDSPAKFPSENVLCETNAGLAASPEILATEKPKKRGRPSSVAVNEANGA